MRNLRTKQNILALVLVMVIMFVMVAGAVYEPFKTKLALFQADLLVIVTNRRFFCNPKNCSGTTNGTGSNRRRI